MFMKKDLNFTKFAFFGTSDFSVLVLDELKTEGLVPALVITSEDKPAGRKMKPTPPPVKIWAEKNSVEFLQQEKLKDEKFLSRLEKENFDFFLVASYGKILPKELIDLPKRKTLNIHPSLLPKLRGASPIQTAILNDEKETGISVMVVDELMDHGPILTSEKVEVPNWPPKTLELKKIMAKDGAKLLAKILPDWLDGKIKEVPQDESLVTFTKKIEKSDGLINLSDDPYLNYKKIQAYSDWPEAYFFADHAEKKIRVIIKEAEFKNGELKIIRILPEGKKEMSYEDFKRGIRNRKI